MKRVEAHNRNWPARDGTLLDELAALGNHVLHHHWHTQLCGCQHPDQCPNCPAGTWNIGDSLRIILPQVLAAYDHAKEQQ